MTAGLAGDVSLQCSHREAAEYQAPVGIVNKHRGPESPRGADGSRNGQADPEERGPTGDI